jgi:hypothetical protein
MITITPGILLQPESSTRWLNRQARHIQLKGRVGGVAILALAAVATAMLINMLNEGHDIRCELGVDVMSSTEALTPVQTATAHWQAPYEAIAAIWHPRWQLRVRQIAHAALLCLPTERRRSNRSTWERRWSERMKDYRAQADQKAPWAYLMEPVCEAGKEAGGHCGRRSAHPRGLQEDHPPPPLTKR